MSEADDSPADWLSAAETRFADQVRRARGLLTASAAVGEPDAALDVRRAAVVLLHAALEDLVRAVQRRRLPRASPDVLNRIPIPVLPDGPPREKVGLGVLIDQFDGKSVREAVAICVGEYVDRRAYSNPAELARALREVGVTDTAAVLGTDARVLSLIASRRHQIVHRGDHDPAPGASATQTSPLAKARVWYWSVHVEQVGGRIVAAVRQLEEIPDAG